METAGTCPICEREEEDTFHALYKCPLAVQLWECMATVWRLPKREELKNTCTEWLLEVLHPLSEIERGMLLMSLWRVWHNRNEVTHNKEPPPMEASKQFLMGYLDSLLSLKYSAEELLKGKQVVAYDRLPEPQVIPSVAQNILWVLPTEGWSKLNIDGSWTDGGKAGAGMALRDNKGQIIYTSCRELFSRRNALEAELSACMEGLSLAIQRTELPIQVEMDSREALSMITNDSIDRSIFSSMVKEIKFLRNLRTITLNYVHRSQNNVSDFLAKFARTKSSTVVWLNSGLAEVIELCNADCGPT